jgi:hypothetical protein
MELNQDEHHLNILSIFHYVVGGLTALFACFPIFHLMMGLGFLFGGFGPPPEEEFPFRLFGLMFTVIPAVIILTGWVLAGFIAAAGYHLSKRQHYTFCLVIAGVECIFIPFGTVLGIFTIIVLVRPGVKALFEPGQTAESAPDLPDA